MQANLEKITGNTAYINIEIDEAEFKKGVDKAYVKNAKHFSIPGFRKGKAPKVLIEQYYGPSIFYEDAVNILLPDAYEDAVRTLNLEPVDRPDFEIKEIGEGQKGVSLSATVTLKPKVELGKYKGIELKKVEYPVTDEDLDKEIQSYRERNSRIITVEDRAVKDGDIVTIDFKGYKDGEPFPGGEGKEHELTIGSGQFIPGFEQQLIGCEIGAEPKVSVTFPDDYHADDLKGAKAEFEVKIHSIKVKELPETDDEFAKDISEFDTFEEFKNDIKEKLNKQASERQKMQMENDATQAAAENTKVDIPACMIDSQIDVMLRDYEMRLRQQGLSLENYLQITNMSIDDFKGQFSEQAEKQVKITLTLEQIIKEENIEVTEQETEDEITRLAELYNIPAENVKNAIPADDIKRDVKTKKAIDIIVSNAVIK
ncbi:MAG: trigger factor [Firmicutes bacterium]|nr:trigger factor [Bacillota bacterium]